MAPTDDGAERGLGKGCAVERRAGGNAVGGQFPTAARCNVNESEIILMIDKNGWLWGRNGRRGGHICGEHCIFAEKQHLS